MLLKGVILMYLLIGCSQSVHRSPRDIYDSGKVENWSDFYRINNDHDTLVDVFIYKYDTAFMVRKHYGDNRTIVRGYSFYYNNMKEGKWLLVDFNGKLVGESNFRKDKYNGLQLIYNDKDGSLRKKEYYEDGILLYEVNYSKKGDFLDSISYQK